MVLCLQVLYSRFSLETSLKKKLLVELTILSQFVFKDVCISQFD